MLDLKYGSVIYLPYDLGQVIYAFWTSVSCYLKWANDTVLIELYKLNKLTSCISYSPLFSTIQLPNNQSV